MNGSYLQVGDLSALQYRKRTLVSPEQSMVAIHSIHFTHAVYGEHVRVGFGYSAVVVSNVTKNVTVHV